MKKYNTKSISSTLLYKPEEVASRLGTHPNTIYRWLKGGLSCAGNSKFILGSKVKRFISDKKKKRRVKLAANEFYCPRCKTATVSKTSSLKYIETAKVLSGNIKQIVITGECIKCDCTLTRFESGANIEKFKSLYKQGV